MGAFGGPTLKPTLLYANDRLLLNGLRHKSVRKTFKAKKSLVRVAKKKDGRKTVTGNKELRVSQCPP